MTNTSLLRISPISLAAHAALAVVAMAQGDGDPPLPTERGQWWQYRGNRQLSGRSSAIGNIKTPGIAWNHPIASRQTLLGVRLREGPETVDLPPGDAGEPEGGRSYDETIMDWRVAGLYRTAWLDLDGNGTLTPCSFSYNAKIGKLLPDVPGLQLVEAEPRGYPKVPGVYEGTVRLKVREGGQWVTRWETITETLIWSCEPIFGDFDGDGRNEIALLPWYRLNILDAATGKLKETCNYLAEDGSEIPGHGGRAYGWFGAVDVDGDGTIEFVIVEDFIRYATVIGRRDGRLTRLWINVWEPEPVDGRLPSQEEAVVVRIGPEPVQDVDGDGVREIVVSVFNHTGDMRWHVIALDPLTGKTKIELPGQFLTGLHDVTGDGTPDFLCTAVARGPRVPNPADISVVSCRGGTQRTVWRRGGSAFVVHTQAQPPGNVNSGAALGGDTVLCGPIAPGQPHVFFTRDLIDRATGATRVTCWQAEDGGIGAIASWIGPRIEPLMVREGADGAASVLLQAAAFEGEAAQVKCPQGLLKTEVLVSRRAAAPVSPVVVGRPTPDDAPLIVVEGANETVEAFRPTGDGKTARVWRVPGRGMTCNNYREGVALADLSGKGQLSVVLGTRGPADCARLAAVSLKDGTTAWTRDFEDFPGTPPPWNVPGLMYWQGGYFRDRTRMDLIVQIRRIAGESYLIDGRTGEVGWCQTQGRPGRGFGRSWLAIYDFDGDGFEDALNIYPDMYCVARGTDGKLLVAKESHEYVDTYAYYADMIVGDFTGLGKPQMLYAHEFVTALFDGGGRRIWKIEHVHPLGWRNQVAAGDVDGDGKLELLFPGAMSEDGRELQCRDAATGALKWRVSMPDAVLSFPAVADIDGDGRDECVFTINNRVYAVGAAKEGGQGAIRWTLDLPARVGATAVADTEGNGGAQIIVVCADGNVYGIDEAGGR